MTMVDLPEIHKYKIQGKRDSLYIGVAGFEDRSIEFLKRSKDEGIKFNSIVGFEYLPEDKKNMKDRFNSLSDTVYENDLKWITYDRREPEASTHQMENLAEFASYFENVIIDISGMSKFLLVNLLHHFQGISVNLDIVYFEADAYYPLRDEFKDKFDSASQNVPQFLTGDVHSVVTTSSMTNTVMQGEPKLLITFPTFNNKDFSSLILEIMPQHVEVLVGEPLREENKWRSEAVRKLNDAPLGDLSSFEEDVVSTFYYENTVEKLFSIYNQYADSYRIVIAPTGSKLQSFASFIFKNVYPDVQMVYPVTQEFYEEYSKGVRQLWGVSLDCFSGFIDRLDKYRWKDVRQLENKTS